MDSHLIDSMTCPICFEIAENAVETSCCHQVYCEYCLSIVGNNPCPQCRQQFTILVSHISRRIIGSMPVHCVFKGCEAKVMRSELKDHEAKCTHRLYSCPSPRCLFEGLRDTFAVHLATDHQYKLLESAAKIFEETPCSTGATQNEDRITTRENGRGDICRLGSTGKFYCGKRIDGIRCSCCDSYCGPTNGCNCSYCMKLDVEARKLPKGWFVNRDGHACRVSRETGHTYCGRLMMESSQLCDGYCGPTNGPNCQSCRIMDHQLINRYHSVWQH